MTGSERYPRGVAVIGLGYIGLPTSAVLADHGVRVHGVDVDARVVDAVSRGAVHIVEPDLDTVVHRVVEAGLLTASTEMVPADVYVVAVPTPFKGDHEPDLRHVEQATRSLAPLLRRGDLVILESTSPPGSTSLMSRWIAEERPDLALPHDRPEDPDVHLAHCPERVLPGRTLEELVTNDRIVGGLTPECSQRAAELYRVFVEGEISLTDAATAEMSKLVENTFRDVNIAFANELAAVCDRLGLDVWRVIELANHHPRVQVLQPGPGVGGHCIAVDPWFIADAAPDEARLIRQAREVNDARPQQVVDQVAALAPEGGTVACLGLAFKPDVDDTRESPAVTVVQRLADSRPDLRLAVVEPHVASLPASLAHLDNVRLGSLDAALEASEVVLLLVHHAEFIRLDQGRLQGMQVVDTRGVWRDRPRPTS
ncbi:MAG: UDP-N-acetyl-D-mannosamine dehydrogenase [Marmoricola sp.]